MKPVRVPGDLDISLKLFGRFTVRDLIRISVPVLPGLLSASVWLIAFGILVGGIWYGVRPFGRSLDSHLYHVVRWSLAGGRVKGTDLGELETAEASTGVDETKIKTGTGSLAAVIRVEPTNLDLKTDAEQQALHSIYQELLETVNYPVQIHSRQEPFSLEGYIDQLKDRDETLLNSDYIEFCEGFEDSELTLTQHYIVVHADQDGISYLRSQYYRLKGTEPSSKEETLESELDSRCREIIEAIDTTDLSANRLTGPELTTFTEKYDHPIEKTSPKWSHGRESRRTIQIDEYPSTVELGWPLQLLRTEGMIDIVQTLRPRNPGQTTKKLQRISEKLNAEINSLLAGGHRGTNKIEGLLEDTEWFLDLLADRQATPVDYSTSLTVHHPDQEHAEKACETVCNRLDTLGFSYSHPFLKPDLGYQSDSPFYPSGLQNRLLVPASSAAAGLPFATQNTESTGIIYGTDSYDGTPILLDRFQWSSHSMARMGMVGSGKSYAAKIELLRATLIYDDLNIIVVDPKQEYSPLIRLLGGDLQTVTADTDLGFDHDISCFTVEERGRKENAELLTETVEQIYSHVSQDSSKTLVLIDEARILLNDEDGKRILNQFVLEGRDTNTAVTLVTQNASHFTHSREGREILDNMPGKVFMRHDRVPEDVVNYFQFSQREKQELFELRTGTDSAYSEALLHVSGRISTRLRIDSTPQEHAVLSTGEETR